MQTMDTGAACKHLLQLLSFQLGGLEYGLDFQKVQELRVLKSLERFASDGAIISGVAVSRGVIMPIVDMRVAFDGPRTVPDPMTDVIILALSSGVVGMVVDGITDVVTVDAAQVSPIPAAADVDYLIGLAEVEGRRLILVDIDKLMSVKRKVADGARQAA